MCTGEWQIGILYDNEHIRGSPFSCFVYDANLVQVYGLDVGLVGQELKFNVNSVQAGQGNIKARSIPVHNRAQSYTRLRVVLRCRYRCCITAE